MLTTRTYAPTRNTLNVLARFLWKDHKYSKRPDNEALADALNLLSKPSTKPKYKPSLFKSLAGDPIDEQLSNVNRSLYIKQESHVNEQFVNNLLWGIKSSLLDPQINHSQLLNDMSPDELSSYIKRMKSEDHLREIVQLFHNHDRLTLPILREVLLNKSLKNLDNFPISLTRFDGITGIDEKAAVHLNIIMLKKYYDLNRPLDIIRNLKMNFAKDYLPLIESRKLSPFYERIVWRFVFEYLRQYNEEHYIRSLESLHSSFLIWESSSYSSSQAIAHIVLENHSEMSKLQNLFFKIASFTRTHEVPKLRKISIKHKLYQNREDKKSLYAVLSDLESLLVSSQSEYAKPLLEELAMYRLELVQETYSTPASSFEGLELSKA
ncbi:hypothetical protein KGF57_003700 [Candida theae]|uniref:Uncharacterized protein n=1 Tax=Candida theae TaxID=1198502 RepID=A0AAD5BDA4_9ASCO|nr:uncharacterized protein KGF57_003700 [Candida theae]KAI5955567.1 hypothetical protein KGF57_003700 [Candida theae]